MSGEILRYPPVKSKYQKTDHAEKMGRLRALVLGLHLPDGWTAEYAQSSVRFVSPAKKRVVKIGTEYSVSADIIRKDGSVKSEYHKFEDPQKAFTLACELIKKLSRKTPRTGEENASVQSKSTEGTGEGESPSGKGSCTDCGKCGTAKVHDFGIRADITRKESDAFAAAVGLE